MKYFTPKRNNLLSLEDYCLEYTQNPEVILNTIPQKKYEMKPNMLLNIDKMINELHYGFTNNKRFFLQVDSDADGYTSAAIFYAFFKQTYPNSNIKINLHPGKEHGIKLNDIDIDVDFIVVPDAGSNQVDEQLVLAEQGRKVLIIDHHIVDVKLEEHPNITIVNNRISPGSNESLSGAGVVYKVIQAYSEKFLTGREHHQFVDVAAVGIVADMMDTTVLDNDYLIKQGRILTNPFLKTIMKAKAFSVSNRENPLIKDISWYIAPVINGVIRFGTQAEKEIIFTALADYKLPRSKYEEAVSLAEKVKRRQDAAKKKGINFLKESQKEVFNDQLLIFITSHKDKVPIPSTITGLVAMDIQASTLKPVLVLRPQKVNNKEIYSGSLRGGGKYIPSLKQFLTDSGLCIFAQGHDNAAGVAIEKHNLQKLRDYGNEKLKDIDFSKELNTVETILTGKENINDLINYAEKGESIYSRFLPEPLFGFVFEMNKTDLKQIGAKGTTLKLTSPSGQYDFIKFNAKKEIEQFDNLTFSIKVHIIGRANINNYNKMKKVQFFIDKIWIENMESLF